MVAATYLALIGPPSRTAPLPEKTIEISGQRIIVEIAATPQALYQGLSGRSELKAGHGMLFDFSESGERIFVMRDMLFPLDIIFINQGRITKIAANLPPEGRAPLIRYSSDGPADQVLELKAGYASERGFQVGDQVVIEKE